MSSPPPPDQAHHSPPSPTSASEATQPGRSGFDYALLIGNSVLFLAYLPIFGAVPRLLQHHLDEFDLLWCLPLLLMCSCLLLLSRWLLSGVTVVGRLIWAVLLVLTALAYPAGIMVVAAMGPAPTRHYDAPAAPDPSPVWVEPKP